MGFRSLELFLSNFISQTQIKLIATNKLVNYIIQLQLHLYNEILMI